MKHTRPNTRGALCRTESGGTGLPETKFERFGNLPGIRSQTQRQKYRTLTSPTTGHETAPHTERHTRLPNKSNPSLARGPPSLWVSPSNLRRFAPSIRASPEICPKDLHMKPPLYRSLTRHIILNYNICQNVSSISGSYNWIYLNSHIW